MDSNANQLGVRAFYQPDESLILKRTLERSDGVPYEVMGVYQRPGTNHEVMLLCPADSVRERGDLLAMEMSEFDRLLRGNAIVMRRQAPLKPASEVVPRLEAGEDLFRIMS